MAYEGQKNKIIKNNFRAPGREIKNFNNKKQYYLFRTKFWGCELTSVIVGAFNNALFYATHTKISNSKVFNQYIRG